MKPTAAPRPAHLRAALAAVFLFAPHLAQAAPTPPCGERLAVALDAGGGDLTGMSHAGAYLTVRNGGGATCAVAALPVLRFADGRDGVAPLARAADEGAGAVAAPSLVLHPGQAAKAQLRWTSGDVYGGHHCLTPATMTVALGVVVRTLAWTAGPLCGPAGAPVPYRQSPLRIGP